MLISELGNSDPLALGRECEQPCIIAITPTTSTGIVKLWFNKHSTSTEAQKVKLIPRNVSNISHISSYKIPIRANWSKLE